MSRTVRERMNEIDNLIEGALSDGAVIKTLIRTTLQHSCPNVKTRRSELCKLFPSQTTNKPVKICLPNKTIKVSSRGQFVQIQPVFFPGLSLSNTMFFNTPIERTPLLRSCSSLYHRSLNCLR